MAAPTVFVTCPPMLGLIDEFKDDFAAKGLVCVPGKVTQVKTVAELIDEVPNYDAWIIGDDPANREVIAAGVKGRLKAAVKWGVGVDNVDFAAFKDFGVPVENTPGVFGGEVADVALTYALGLARETYRIDREIRLNNAWPKPAGISMAGRTVAIVGFGDIGRQTAQRILACGSKVIAYDPAVTAPGAPVEMAHWPERIGEADFIIFTCPLNAATRRMFNHDLLSKLKKGVRVVNVSRGPVVEEAALVKALDDGIVHSAALDVFEVEPLIAASPLRRYDNCIFGSHNGSNSVDAVRRVSRIAIDKIDRLLKSVAR